MFPSIPVSRIDPRVDTVLTGVGYAFVILIAGWLLGFSITSGRSLLGSPVPVLVPALLGTALIGGLVAVLAGVGLRSPPLVLLAGSGAMLYAEAASLRPAAASLLGMWPTLAALVIAIGGIEYGPRRNRHPSVRRSASTERALLGGAIAACLVLAAFSLRGAGPLAVLFATGSVFSLRALEAVLSTFGPPALLIWLSMSLLLGYGLLTPLLSIPAVGALLANPLGFAFSLFAAASPLLFVVVLVLGAGEYALRARSSSFRPRSLVG
ncbi:hypothetical protein BRC86_08565 [Halobacteriales archaeon QS_3_64_16]|nr:MAG: hypothetical protein BRC86_08565 [Halobacteriales archaeon QS_3_64_16]